MFSQGPNYSSTYNSSGSAWNSPVNAVGAANYSGNAHSVDFNGKSNSGLLLTMGYGFSLPDSSTITGIKVEVIVGGTGSGRFTTAMLVQNGMAAGVNKGTSLSWMNQTLGSSSDLWGLTWTPPQINDVDFGFALSGIANSNATDLYYSGARITIYYTFSKLIYFQFMTLQSGGTFTSHGLMSGCVL